MQKGKKTENRLTTLEIEGAEVEVLEISTSNAAQALKADLRSVFGSYYPGLRFSVRTALSGYRPILEVGWTDGPAYEEVERVSQKFIGRTEDQQPIICQNLLMYEGKRFVYRVSGVSLHHSFSDPEKERQAIARVYQQ